MNHEDIIFWPDGREEAKSSLIIEVPAFFGCFILTLVFLYFIRKEVSKGILEQSSVIITVCVGGAVVFGVSTLSIFNEMMASIVTWAHCNSILNNLF